MKWKLNRRDVARAVDACMALTEVLNATKSCMFHSDAHVHFGLRKPGDPWLPVHQHQVTYIYELTAYVAANVGERLDFSCYVDKRTGRPGTGLARPNMFSTAEVERRIRAWENLVTEGCVS